MSNFFGEGSLIDLISYLKWKFTVSKHKNTYTIHARKIEASFLGRKVIRVKKTIHSPHSRIISQTLIQIRKDAELTQRQLAKLLEREHSFVAHYELGERRIDLAEFYWICKACHASAPVHATQIMEMFSKLESNITMIKLQ